ncbi:peptidoglycan-binding domain-containing protein [Enhygromyxa salina]|nr:peptidoglycan-binding domain-containing protein [Enhygromyxa salina]
MASHGVGDLRARTASQKWRQITQLLRLGQMRVVERPRVLSPYSHIDIAPAPAPAPDAPQPIVDQQAWFELILEDDFGRVLANVEHRLTLPDLSIVEGRSDTSGRVFIEQLAPGHCKLELTLSRWPDLPDMDTPKAPAAPPASRLLELRPPFSGRLPSFTLPTLVHNRVRLQPSPIAAHAAVGFRAGSSFVSPGLAIALRSTAGQLEQVSSQLGLFGHSDPSGSGADNKALSERRAAAMRALASSDADVLFEIADHERWGLDEYQAMLRGLGFIPGAIDDTSGPMTDAAIEAFVEANAERWLSGLPPSKGPSLDEQTQRAIVSAYVEEYGLGLDPSRLLGTVASGCREFNDVKTSPAQARRVTLAVFTDPAKAPRTSDLPCVEGDSGACTLDREDGLRCRFFRHAVAPRDLDAVAVEWFDFAWLRTPTGKIHLSALTTAPDTDDVEFEIGIADGGLPSPPPSSAAGGHAGTELRKLGRAAGLVRHGVCYALWDPEGFDPFDPRQWFETDPDAPEIEGLPVPTFKITLGRDWAYSTPPGRRLDRIVLVGDAQRDVIALLSDGSYARFAGQQGLQQVAAEAGGLHVLALYPWNGLISPAGRRGQEG